jgi:hypothetical protein
VPRCALAISTFAALLLTACGGGATRHAPQPASATPAPASAQAGPTQAQIAAAADAICGQADIAAQNFVVSRSAPSTLTQVLLAVSTDRDIADAAVAKLTRLHPPPVDRVAFEQFVSAIRGLGAGDAQFLAGLTEVDKTVENQGAAAVATAGAAATRGADAYGLRGCPFDTIAQRFLTQTRAAQLRKRDAAEKVAAARDPVGTWTGDVTQNGPGNKRYHYGADMIVRDVNRIGARAGSIAYPAFPCSGYLQLAGRHANRFVFVEHITQHPHTCPSGGRITSTIHSGTMHWHWERRGLVVKGTLTRR